MMLEQRVITEAVWRNSTNICAYADRERHLGHIVWAGTGWLAFDATHPNTERNAFRPLGFFQTISKAKEAVELATGWARTC